MKKLLSLLMATVLFITIIGAVPVVSAEEIQYEPVDKEFIKEYWESYWGADSVVKVGDWYYKFTNTYYGDRYLSGVCGYDGNETEITIPTKLGDEEVKAVEKFYLFSDTVKTINIPKEIRFKDVYYFDEYMRFTPFTNLEEIVVEKGHSSYWSKDGILFKGSELCLYPPAKKDREYVIPDGVTEIATGAFYDQVYLKSLTIPQSVYLIYEDAITPTLENLYFYTEKNLYSNLREQFWSSESGYSYVEMPRVPYGTIHCIEGTELDSYYSKFKYYKNLNVLKDELVKKEDGNWYHFRGGIIDVNKSSGYIHPDLVKYKGKWFYTEEGIWTKKKLLFEYKGKWFYIKNGKWEKDTNDLVWYKGKWFYLENGKWDRFTPNTLFKKNGKWFAIRAGKWYKGKDIIEYNGKEFFVNNGFVQFDYSGKVKIDGETYKIKNGKVA